MHFKASLAVLILIFSTLIISHQRSESYSRIDITNDKNLVVEIDFNVQISVLSRIKSNFDQFWESKLQEEILKDYKHGDEKLGNWKDIINNFDTFRDGKTNIRIMNFLTENI